MSEKNFHNFTGNLLFEKGFKTGKNINSMRVRLPKPVSKEFFELIASSENFESWTKLSEKLSCSRWTLGQIKLGRRTFPKRAFEELLEFIPSDRKSYFLSNSIGLGRSWSIQERWNKKLSELRKKLKRRNSPEHLKLKAKLCAYLAGDGTIARRISGKQATPRHDISFFPDDLQMAETIKDAFYKMYDKKLKIMKAPLQNYYILRTTSKTAYEDLIKIAKFGTHEWRVPFDFLKTAAMKSEWLKVFYDCEAYVGKRKIQLQSVNKAGIQDVKDLLENIGIDASKIYEYNRKQKNWSTNYLLEIRRKENLKNYLKLVGFNHSSKKAKLNAQVAGMAESG